MVAHVGEVVGEGHLVGRVLDVRGLDDAAGGRVQEVDDVGFGADDESELAAGGELDLAQAGQVTVKVYSPTGQEVKTLLNSHMNPGAHEVSWDGTNEAGKTVSSGVYLYQLEIGDSAIKSDRKRMVLLK